LRLLQEFRRYSQTLCPKLSESGTPAGLGTSFAVQTPDLQHDSKLQMLPLKAAPSCISVAQKFVDGLVAEQGFFAEDS
jgi:hypothetical protein